MIFDFTKPNKKKPENTFRLLTKLDEMGYQWHIAIWHDKKPHNGDIVLMPLEHHAVIKRVRTSKIIPNMYIVEIDTKGGYVAYLQAKKKLELKDG